jgi:hypothetical protein
LAVHQCSGSRIDFGDQTWVTKKLISKFLAQANTSNGKNLHSYNTTGEKSEQADSILTLVGVGGRVAGEVMNKTRSSRLVKIGEMLGSKFIPIKALGRRTSI